MNSTVTWFASKVDWWLGIILFVVPLSPVAVIASGLIHGDRTEVAIGFMTAAFIGALYGLVVLPVRYGISAEELIVRHGVVRQRIRLAAIQDVTPSHNPLSSPALSLDRLKVRVGKGLTGFVLISPADREGFLTLLEKSAGLIRDGNRLIRALTPQ